ncbi:GIY-YIG nuclease family protein [Marinomonas ostreistagni]|uniref:GIY-YIG nuclease family protein n=1 Tax=Marinomonas ostreistagni TaxID=359209 RepID=A0ABS0ZCX7_9GAMM|nr:GIY-YIG nuclease family protein [Marinomonas ostreistagni]MBJ7551253.1 GIY-YIG nuclease family protein [Marinomonas ostreistagni]
MALWSVYMIETRCETLYTGVSTDVSRRFAEHESGGAKCARYLRGKQPLALVWQQAGMSKKLALKVEYRIKRLPRIMKDRIVSGQVTLSEVFPELFN